MSVTETYAFAGLTEPLASMLHLGGALVVALSTGILLRRGDAHPGRKVALGIFAVSAGVLLAASGIYHLLAFDTLSREIAQRIDHGAIFGLIAGTYTPIHTILFVGLWRWAPLTFLWTAAGTGITVKSILGVQLSYADSTALYIALGWVGGVSVAFLWHRYGFAFIFPLLAGGVVYTAGAVYDASGGPPIVPGVFGSHEVFHLSVLVGMALHWRFVSNIADHMVEPVPAGRPGVATKA